MTDYVADESVDNGIISGLRKNGLKVISIAEIKSGISDKEVLEVAFNYKCVLITEDKDFGELVVRLKMSHKGILLIRLNELARKERIETAVKISLLYKEKIENNFSVLTLKGLRIKKL